MTDIDRILAAADDGCGNYSVTLAAEVRRLRAERWQPIETAPRDGTWMLAWVPDDGGVRLVSWGKTSHVPLYGFVLIDEGEDCDLCEPTHWMPLPAGPTP